MTTKRLRLATGLLLAAFALAGCGDPRDVMEAGAVGVNDRVGDILVRNVRVVAPRGPAYRPGQDAVVRLRLINEGASPQRLAAVSSPVARSAEIWWDPECDGGAAPVGGLPLRSADRLAAERQTDAAPFGAYHLRLVGLREEVLAGDSVPIRFDFGRAGRVTVDVIVEPPEAGWASATPVCHPVRP